MTIDINEELEEKQRTLRKLILIENLEELGMTKGNRKKFIKFYYNNLDMNLIEALDEFNNGER